MRESAYLQNGIQTKETVSQELYIERMDYNSVYGMLIRYLAWDQG